MKSRKVYLLLCIFGGWFGLHQFYLLRFGKGIMYMCTAGLFMVGWVRDMVFTAQTVDQYNAARGFMNTDLRNSRGH